jgi:hypothetical protein
VRAPLYVPEGERAPVGALAVDGTVSGAAAVYSHWRDAPEPPRELAADTSTAMALKAAADPRRWLAPYTVVCNNHVDADGLLSVAACCQPERALEHERLLIAAAEAGDFGIWPGEAGFRLMLRLHQLIRDEREGGAGWEQRAHERATNDLSALITESAQPETERDAQVREVREAIRRLSDRDGFAVDTYGRIALIAWKRTRGHHSDSFLAVHQEDDLPVWAIGCAVPEHLFQLLAMEQDGGVVYQLDAPRHSWARTVGRPTVSWPDLSALRERLQQEETGSCRWIDRPLAARIGFVCQLASIDDAGAAAPSRLALGHVLNACRDALERASE